MTALRIVRAFVAATASCAMSGGALHAQAVCSAPHSSPTLSRAGIGIQPFGAGWIQVTGYHTRSTEFFNVNGRTQAFLADGRTTTSSVFITAAGGVGRGIELWVQVPVHRVAFRDQTGANTRVAVGDPRISTRIGGAVFGLDALPVSLRGGIKLPGSEFPVDPDVLPISEGQTDVELVVEAGRVTTGAYPLHVVGWVGYRWRFENHDRDRKPGDERFARIGLGGPAGSLRWDLAVEGLWGAGLEQQGLVLNTARRRLVQVLPTVGWQLGAAQLEATARLSVAGRNLPSGPAVSAGIVLPWALR